jgi:hypothetical protein
MSKSIGGLIVFPDLTQQFLVVLREIGLSQQVGSPFQGSAQRLLSPPGRNLGMISRPKYGRDLPAPKFGRAGVMRTL